MNIVMVSVLLLAMLAFQPTLIYGTKNLASVRSDSNINSGSSRLTSSSHNTRSSRYGKRHLTEPLYSPALSSSSAKLFMSMESGDVLVRSARGATADNQNISPATGNNDGKRQKNNKKPNKNVAAQEGQSASAIPSSSSSTSITSNRGRKHLDKKSSVSLGLSSNQKHQQQQQLHSNNNKGNNKQRQMLKSQNHQNKRSGGKASKEHVEKTQSETTTCRYAKSAWSECDPKTNMRSRTLTLKKGEANCLETRIMQKKCKKSCRYEKGAWSECTNGQMTREDKLKSTGGIESSCEAIRSINKKCNPNNAGATKQVTGGTGSGNSGKRERKNKEKGSRRVVKN